MTEELARELHQLEREFGMPAVDILDVINSRNRCKIAVRGAIAEAHLLNLLRELQAEGRIESWEDFDRDGYPDCRVTLDGRSYLIECKNVEKKSKNRVTIDFQRTRNPIGKPWERYYLPSEFDVIAACLWNYNQQWVYRFAATRDLPRHHTYEDRLSNRLTVDLGPSEIWLDDLPKLLSRLPQPSSNAAAESEIVPPPDTPD